MSLLSDTNHTPQRIFALLRLLEFQGGELDSETIKTWFKPELRGIDQRQSEDSNIRQMLGAAASIEVIESAGQNRYRLIADVPDSLEAFADLVHDRLAGASNDHPDSVVLEAYAATIAITEAEQGTTWLDEVAKDRAARINKALRRDGSENGDDSSLRFNSTKYAPWKRWMVFLGLGISMPKSDFYPYPVLRLAREIERFGVNLGSATSCEVEAFMNFVASRMPYLDGGLLFKSAAEQIRLAPLERKVSRVLSGVLRDLHDDKRLKLETIGDTKANYLLTGEPHAVKNFATVQLNWDASRA